MDKFSGKKAAVYVLGEPFYASQVPLVDIEAGWCWCLPDDLHLWDGDVRFEVWRGEWEPAEPSEILPRLGIVAFNRCMEGLHVRASGVCSPTSLISRDHSWSLVTESVLHHAPVMGEKNTGRGVIGSSSAHIDGLVSDSHDNVFVYMPFSRGAFAGCGRLRSGIFNGEIDFNEEGVVYESA